MARNVTALADTPKGQDGRPSKSLTLDQAAAVITTARTLPVMERRPALKATSSHAGPGWPRGQGDAVPGALG